MSTPIPPSSFDPRSSECHLCGSERLRLSKVDFEGRRIDRCLRCRIEFLNPQYTDEYLAALYDGYGGISDSRWSGFDETMNERRTRIHHHYLSRIESYTPVSRFLGIGCGDALELRVAMSRGWDVHGFDVDPKAVSNVERKLDVRAFSGPFHEVPFDGPYDCVYLHHVLEHPKNPQDYLRRIRSLLSPGGLVFVASPNLASLSGWYKVAAARLGLKDNYFKHYDAWQHLFYFTPRKLARLMERDYGFEVVEKRAGVEWRLHGTSLPMEVLTRLDRLTVLKSKFYLLARPRAGGSG